MFCQHEVIFTVYVYDGIFASPIEAAIDQAIAEIGAKFYISYQGTLNNYIGVKIESLPDSKINLL